MAGAVQARVLKEVIRSYSYVMLWMSVSISVILFNKWLLAFSGFPYPITLTMWHMAFCSTVGFLCVRGGGFVKSHNMTAHDYIRRVMPIGVLYAASLWLSNSAYLYLSVSFIQMTKSLMPGLVYATGIFMGTEHFSRASAANMMLIAFGVVVCAIGEVNLVFKGVLQQLAALLFEAARLTLVQILINSKGLQMNPIQSLYYVSPACLICLSVPFVLLEFGQLVRDTTVHIYPSVFMANALAAFALNLVIMTSVLMQISAVFLLIGKTSALTMNIAGVIKDWMLIFFSYYLFGAPVTFINLLGYAFCCSGVAVYNYQKLQQIRAKASLSTGKDVEKLGGSSGGGGSGENQTMLNGHNDSQVKLTAEAGPKNGITFAAYRSKDDIMEEIRRLQSEMAKFEEGGSAGAVDAASKEN